MSGVSPWDRPPREGPCLCARKNSRVSSSKVKAGVFRETHIPQAGSGPSEMTGGGPRIRGG